MKTAVPSGSAGPPCKMVAIYNYNPHELSPNVDAEVLNLYRSTCHLFKYDHFHTFRLMETDFLKIDIVTMIMISIFLSAFIVVNTNYHYQHGYL